MCAATSGREGKQTTVTGSTGEGDRLLVAPDLLLAAERRIARPICERNRLDADSADQPCTGESFVEPLERLSSLTARPAQNPHAGQGRRPGLGWSARRSLERSPQELAPFLELRAEPPVVPERGNQSECRTRIVLQQPLERGSDVVPFGVETLEGRPVARPREIPVGSFGEVEVVAG